MRNRGGWRTRLSEWGMGNGEWKKKPRNVPLCPRAGVRFSFPIPHSPFPIKKRRPGDQGRRACGCQTVEGGLLVLFRLLLRHELDRLGDFFIALAVRSDGHRGEIALLVLAPRLLVLETVLDVRVLALLVLAGDL